MSTKHDNLVQPFQQYVKYSRVGLSPMWLISEWGMPTLLRQSGGEKITGRQNKNRERLGFAHLPAYTVWALTSRLYQSIKARLISHPYTFSTLDSDLSTYTV